MTNRIALAMLATVWAILIASGVTAYFTARSVVLANWDQAMVDRTALVSESDRFVARNQLGQKVQPGTAGDREKYRPTLQWAKFVTLAGGARERTVSVHTFIRKSDGTIEPVTASLSESTEPFDRLMNRLMWALVVSCGAGGIIAAFVARAVASIALRPLRSTADAIGQIDEKNLSRRIDSSKLAPELVPVADRLNEMLARLEDSFENRKRFIADASHELRTPVAALVTTLEVSLRRLRDAEAYRETMQTCLADARLLRTLVEALMRQARAEIAAFREDVVQADVSALLRECIAILLSLAEQKNVTLTEAIEEAVHANVQLGRLKQVVMGLLENAIDHNRPGGIVELSLARTGDELQICVRDTGPGIAPEHLAKIFQPFYRASASREVGGHMGLGLYLVRTHLDAMGAKCSVDSEIGKGSVFKILLPAPKKAQALAPAMAG